MRLMAKIDPFVQVEDGEPSPKSTRKEANLRFCQLLGNYMHALFY